MTLPYCTNIGCGNINVTSIIYQLKHAVNSLIRNINQAWLKKLRGPTFEGPHNNLMCNVKTNLQDRSLTLNRH